MEIWQKIKNLYTGNNRFFTWFVTLWVLFFTWSWLWGNGNTIFHWVDAKKEFRNQNAQIEYYKNEIEKMDVSIDHRASSLDTLEKFAREQYLMSAPGEDVFVIEK